MKHLLITALMCLPTLASASDTARVLELCINPDETPETRVDHLRAEGWQTGGDALPALTVAITLPRINAGNATNWEADRDFAQARAQDAIAREPDTVMLQSPDGAAVVFVGRNTLGLQTCLYLGPDSDLAPISAALDGKPPSRIDTVARLRGEAFKSLISAHAMSAEGRARFDPPLAYGMSFATQLDRQPGEETQLPIPRITR
ncbi:MAG: hypothetical protein AAGF55_06980 [Pseudomonadota bacterium]